MASDLQLSAEDDPEAWAAKLNFAINSRVRVGGFTPFQFVFGRDPEVPASLLNNPGNLSVHHATSENEAARDAEDLRRAAEAATAQADADEKMRRSLLKRPRSRHATWLP